MMFRAIIIHIIFDHESYLYYFNYCYIIFDHDTILQLQLFF